MNHANPQVAAVAVLCFSVPWNITHMILIYTSKCSCSSHRYCYSSVDGFQLMFFIVPAWVEGKVTPGIPAGHTLLARRRLLGYSSDEVAEVDHPTRSIHLPLCSFFHTVDVGYPAVGSLLYVNRAQNLPTPPPRASSPHQRVYPTATAINVRPRPKPSTVGIVKNRLETSFFTLCVYNVLCVATGATQRFHEVQLHTT